MLTIGAIVFGIEGVAVKISVVGETSRWRGAGKAHVRRSKGVCFFDPGGALVTNQPSRVSA